LLAACSPDTIPADRNALVYASRLLVARQHPLFVGAQGDFATRLTRLLALETDLWKLASKHGGRTDRLPYALRLRALGWFWTPEAHAPGLDPCTLCIRCGELIPPTTTGRLRRTSPPRCPHCSKEPPAARRWPTHAIAPDAPGTWWLRCEVEGCDNPFVGQRHERLCDQHDPRRLTRRSRARDR
jgi:hypothetical protein